MFIAGLYAGVAVGFVLAALLAASREDRAQ